MKRGIRKCPFNWQYLHNLKGDKLLENRLNVRCPACGSYRFVKDGLHRTSEGKVQRYLCKDCTYRFTFLGEVRFS
ncbi:MAG: IS1/IS1595 family N-terminal zinc-binding domain-containing protein [Candidatus Bathyarchaeia archaeon]|jgi:DNA-directed RNA polymerase subunit RPC12/RpoP